MKDIDYNAVDGLKLAFNNNKELRKDFNVKNRTLKYTQPSEAKFSAIMEWIHYRCRTW